ncbi:MAG TPA: NADAR family protein, partial [Oligoflexus sp.]|uniref:NADAR family protein n=1 Tax=Oligoflexus sp. TaxID=1971216 RepID=UPI002D5E973E
PSHGRVNESCLSQWHVAPFVIENHCYPTAEHFMMAEKARLFNDGDARQQIMDADQPGLAKKSGRLITGFDEATWNRERFSIVVRGNLEKFKRNEHLRLYLLQTGDKILVEASPYDRIWGIGMGREHPHASNPLRWEGENLLGFALMEVRRRLREDASISDA